MVMKSIVGVLPLPAASTEVFEAGKVSAEVRSDYSLADSTERVFKIGINLNLLYGEGEGRGGEGRESEGWRGLRVG